MPTNTVISFPIPLFANVPIEPQFFQPSRFVISAISFGVNTTVTTSVAHNYVIGQLVRLLIPSKYGSIGLNEQLGYVISIPSATSVEVNINSQGTTPFIPSPTFIAFQSQTPPQIVAVGDINSGIVNSSGIASTSTLVPGSFQNISPL